MPQSALRLGERIGPFEGRLGAERLRAFAAATKDPSWREPPGSDVPACAVATLLWTAQTESRVRLIPQPFQESAAGGVHGEHEITLHRNIELGETLFTWVEGVGTRPVGRNSVVTLRYLTFDTESRLVAEQWWTTVWLGVTCAATGDSAPAHAFPTSVRRRPTGTWEIDVEAHMARHYAEASGDWSPHHFDADAARQSGSARPFLHGLCALALCARGAVETLGAGSQATLRRIAVRFARPLPLDARLSVQFYEAGEGVYAFEAASDDTLVISNGRVELVAVG